MRLEDQRWEHDEGEITCDGAVIARVLTPDDFPCLDPDENDIEAICKEIHATGELIAQAPAMLAMLRRIRSDGDSSLNGTTEDDVDAILAKIPGS